MDFSGGWQCILFNMFSTFQAFNKSRLDSFEKVKLSLRSKTQVSSFEERHSDPQVFNEETRALNFATSGFAENIKTINC